MRARAALLAAALLGALLVAGGAAAQAEVTPAEACAALAGEGLEMGPWTTDDDAFGENIVVRNFRCLSEPLAIQGGEGRFITSSYQRRRCGRCVPRSTPAPPPSAS